MTNNDETTHIISMDNSSIEAPMWTACLVVLQGANIGNKIPLNKEETTIGRAAGVDICLTQGGVSRRHATIKRINDRQFLLIDNDSTNGTLVNSNNIKNKILNDQDIIGIGDGALKFIASDSPEQAYYDALYRQSQMDKALNIYNKYYFLTKLDDEMVRSHAVGNDLSLLLLDIDHFKRLNDGHGHLAGDAALILIAGICKNCIRKFDVLCRYGGEEFGVIAPYTNQQQAYMLAEYMRAQVAKTPFEYAGKTLSITISVGVTSYSASDMHPCEKEWLIAQADKALYQAKQNGRNKVMVFNEALCSALPA
ncbi:MAG: GGDEF domain-containing protein [Methylococcaceae bacterium]|nr:MAG: GGDEF domain-containing protein [Methylococcaceae bacterium]